MLSLFRIEHAQYGWGPFYESGMIARGWVPDFFDEDEGWPTVKQDHWNLGVFWSNLKSNQLHHEWHFAFTRKELIASWFPKYSPSVHAPYQLLHLTVAACGVYVGKDQAIFLKKAVLSREVLHA